jgi:hypothetical protein
MNYKDHINSSCNSFERLRLTPGALFAPPVGPKTSLYPSGTLVPLLAVVIAADWNVGPMVACCAERNADVKSFAGVCVPVKSSALFILPLNGVPLCAGGTIWGGVVATVAAEGNSESFRWLNKCNVEKITRY